jgi:hypothetical protein
MLASLFCLDYQWTELVFHRSDQHAMGIGGSSEVHTAQRLVLEHGWKKALQLTVTGRTKAKRARNRREYQFWATVASEIE